MFRESIQKMVDRVEGGLAGILMGYDGIAVESYTRPGAPGTDIQTVGMELSHIIVQVRKAAEMLEAGGMREMTVKMDTLTVVIQPLNDEYFLACAIAPDGNFGKARYLARTLGPQIRAEL